MQEMNEELRRHIDKIGATRLEMAQRKLEVARREEVRMAAAPEMVRALASAEGVNRKQRRAEAARNRRSGK